MYLGTIMGTAPKEKELYTNPRHPYARALLSAVSDPGSGSEERAYYIKE